MRVLAKTGVTALGLLAMAAHAAPPEGIYLRQEMAGNFSTAIMVFKGGQVARNPEGDLEKFDFAAFKARQPRLVGSYARSGDTLAITWGDGTKIEGRLKPDKNGGFDYRSDAYAAVKPLPRGAKLEGRFTGGASVAGAYGSTVYTFSADGGYARSSGGSASASTRQGTATASVSRGGKGRWAVSGNRLTLTPEGGAAETRNIYHVPMSRESSPSMLVIDGSVFTRAGK